MIIVLNGYIDTVTVSPSNFKVTTDDITFVCVCSINDRKMKRSYLNVSVPICACHVCNRILENDVTISLTTDYVHAILCRYLLGISDLADRNFLMTGGRVISIDEDVDGKVMYLYGTLQKNKASFLHDWLQTGYESLSVAQWVVSDESQRDRLTAIQDKDLCLSLFRPQD